MAGIPHLESTGTSKQLIVHGKAFLVRGAELQNSSFSSARYMRELWPLLVEMNLNTVLGSVSWEMIEPEEGRFDFSEIDAIILDARKHGLKLILLWFGSWKNGMSNYVPSWVKLSPERFPRVYLRNAGGSLGASEILTPLNSESLKADAKAFSTLMKHLKEIDELYSTVIMVQPENECGILGDSRDRSEDANKAFDSPVPQELLDFVRQDWENLHADLKKTLEERHQVDFGNGHSGGEQKTWAAAFGEGPRTDELFMAYHYAKFISEIARAGRAEYDLPMYCNFWQNYSAEGSDNDYPVLAGGGGLPGDYPSGGGVSTVLDIWMKFAKHIDFLSPDVYLNDYDNICSTYRHRSQPLFIPEQRRDEYGARRLWLAIGSYQAIGVAPFGVDSLVDEKCAYIHHFELLASISDLVIEAQRKPDSMIGFFFDELSADGTDKSRPTVAHIGGYEIRIERAFVTGKPGPGYGLVINLGETSEKANKFLLVGQGFRATFKSLNKTSYYTGILAFEEKEVDVANGNLRTLRRFNGDETRSGQFANMPNDNPDYDGFPISITIPARTKLAECTVYHLAQQ